MQRTQAASASWLARQLRFFSFASMAILASCHYAFRKSKVSTLGMDLPSLSKCSLMSTISKPF